MLQQIIAILFLSQLTLKRKTYFHHRKNNVIQNHFQLSVNHQEKEIITLNFLSTLLNIGHHHTQVSKVQEVKFKFSKLHLHKKKYIMVGVSKY